MAIQNLTFCGPVQVTQGEWTFDGNFEATVEKGLVALTGTAKLSGNEVTSTHTYLSDQELMTRIDRLPQVRMEDFTVFYNTVVGDVIKDVNDVLKEFK